MFIRLRFKTITDLLEGARREEVMNPTVFTFFTGEFSVGKHDPVHDRNVEEKFFEVSVVNRTGTRLYYLSVPLEKKDEVLKALQDAKCPVLEADIELVRDGTYRA
jgi:hypothetical protein